MQPRTRRWLTDLLRAGAYIERKTAGRTVRDYGADEDLRSIIERKFEIIGEVLVRVRDHDPATVARITDFQKIIGLRNVLSHAYDDVSPERMWIVIQTALPILMTEVEAILEDDQTEPS
jgi:uncharacterized protein with HEPN domain